MIRTDRKRSRRRLYLILGGLGLVILAAGLAIFQPWLLWVDNDVHDELPTASAGGSSGRQAGTATLISRGTFVSHEHETAGTASLYRTDGINWRSPGSGRRPGRTSACG